MPRALGALLLLVPALPFPPPLLPAATSAVAPSDVRWVTVLTGDDGTFEGELHTVRTDGRGDRLLLDAGIASADIAPDGTVYAIRRDDLLSELLALPVRGGAPNLVESGPEGTFLLSVTTDPDGAPIVGRSVPKIGRAHV